MTKRLSFGRGLLLLAGIFLFYWLTPEVEMVPVGEAQQVVTERPILGVHTRLTDEVEPWKIKQSLVLVREMGAPWAVEFFPWAYYQGKDRQISWNHPDLVVDHAEAQGVKLIARIGMTPDWARPQGTALNYLDEEGYEPFARFVAAFAERYRGRVDYIIIGNEPNLSFEWGYRQTTAVDYVALLQVVYPIVKEVNPDIQILAGALAPTVEPEGSTQGINDLVYLEQMYQLGAAAYFDGLAVHSYGLTFPPEMEPDPEILNFRRVELLREIMVRWGDEGTDIYITETGWNDHPRWTRAVRPAQRIEYTIRALTFAEEQWPYVKMMGIWVFRFPAATRSYTDYYTLVTPEFVKKPIYTALQEYAIPGGEDE